MRDSASIIADLKARGVTQSAVAEVLHIAQPQISKLFSGARQLKLDEACRLVDAFKLEATPSPAGDVISEPVARLLTLWVARELGAKVDPQDARVGEIALDLQAFAQFVSETAARATPDVLNGFFHGLKSARK